MKDFLARYGQKIMGTLSGFDRIVFRGTLRILAHRAGMLKFLSHKSILLKDFPQYAKGITERIKSESIGAAERLDRPYYYLYSSQVRKDEFARDVLATDPVDEGLICVLSCVEPCMTYELRGSRSEKKLRLKYGQGKCLHTYHYYLHPVFGFMHARLQTWFPFTIRVCINGREWLSRQLDHAGIEYLRQKNCFLRIDDLQKAQRLMDKQLRTNWPNALDRIRRLVNPAHSRIFSRDRQYHYWSVHEMEWATDVLFDRPSSLAAIYPDLTRYAITHLSSEDVMRFLGRKLTGNFEGDIVSDYRKRPEGLRVRHRINANSVKIYDKQGSVLRAETTINNPRDIKEFRPKEGDPNGTRSWRRLRRGVSGLKRLAEVAQLSNQRYLDALSELKDSTTVKDLVKSTSRPTKLKGKRVRALQPWSGEDLELLRGVNRGEHLLNGFRNRDISSCLFPKAAAKGKVELKRARAKTTRLLRLLRAHKIIRKVPRTHRYHVTKRGRQIIAAVLAAHEASVSTLLKAA